ncbi:phosphoribosyltransferase family protein [Flexivirga caeni]|uniref:Phosphoribosyltransferase n=1 Tax=Flexivirga caeni TaxID=2294115 RepID=A0A3M9M1J7_9MICO|nr:phosphoribosyltransferase family protein [Flexivirga caeni]RNI19025.1 hypothetical protein EFY87_17375 [Flexivirga caeni]
MTGALAEVRQVVAHPLTGSARTPADAVTGRAFDTRTYSLMKHGDLPSTRTLGAELGAALLTAHPWLTTTDRPIVLPVAYLVARPACYYLAIAVRDAVNAVRGDHGAAHVIHVRKDSVTHIDYAASSEQDRRNDLASIGFRLTEPVRDAIAIVVDDVRVTGLAEQVMVDLLQDNGVGQVVTAYVATCDEQLAADPRVEAALNHAQVRSVFDMLPSVRRGDFVPTIRFLKRLLAEPGIADFLAQCPADLVARFRADAEATGPAFLAGYPHGTAALRAESERRPVTAAEGVCR